MNLENQSRPDIFFNISIEQGGPELPNQFIAFNLIYFWLGVSFGNDRHQKGMSSSKSSVTVLPFPLTVGDRSLL